MTKATRQGNPDEGYSVIEQRGYLGQSLRAREVRLRNGPSRMLRVGDPPDHGTKPDPPRPMSAGTRVAQGHRRLCLSTPEPAQVRDLEANHQGFSLDAYFCKHLPHEDIL